MSTPRSRPCAFACATLLSLSGRPAAAAEPGPTAGGEPKPPAEAAVITGPGQPALAGEAAAVEPAPPRRRATLDFNWTYFPYGQNWIRAGHSLGLNARFPLIHRPGALWNTTNVTVGAKELFMFTANSVALFAELTPIAFFKLNVEAGHEYWFAGLFNGGFRSLTPLGRQRVLDRDIAHGDPDALDWGDRGEGRNNLDNFTPATSAHGARVRIAPTLQGKLGPVVASYTFTADFVAFRAAGRGPDDIFIDGRMFSLRRLRDWAFTHEGNLGILAPKIPDVVLVGATTTYRQLPSTRLSNLFVGGFFYVKPRWRVARKRMSFFLTGQIGANVIDPIYPRSFSWIVGIGADVTIR